MYTVGLLFVGGQPDEVLMTVSVEYGVVHVRLCVCACVCVVLVGGQSDEAAAELLE